MNLHSASTINEVSPHSDIVCERQAGRALANAILTINRVVPQFEISSAFGLYREFMNRASDVPEHQEQDPQYSAVEWTACSNDQCSKILIRIFPVYYYVLISR